MTAAGSAIPVQKPAIAHVTAASSVNIEYYNTEMSGLVKYLQVWGTFNVETASKECCELTAWPRQIRSIDASTQSVSDH